MTSLTPTLGRKEALEAVLEKIGREADKVRVGKFVYWFTFALAQTDNQYATWKRKNNLDDLSHECVIALVRAKLENPNLIPIAKWFLCACLVREGRELRRVQSIAAKFQPARMAAE